MTLTREMVCNHFMQYMFDNTKARHVQRVAAWVGMLVAAIEIRKDAWGYRNKRQFVFRQGERWFKVRYSHGIGSRGGIQIVELSDGRTDGRVVREFTTLTDVENFYLQTLQIAVRKATRITLQLFETPESADVEVVEVPESDAEAA